jgi:hypothetical protein
LKFDESDDLLGTLLYASDSWFAIERPSLPVQAPGGCSQNVLAQQTMPAALAPIGRDQLRFNPVVTAPSLKALPLLPLEAQRSDSTTSIETSPSHRRVKAVARPISPPTVEKRRLRTFSSDNSDDSPSSESSSDDEAFSKPRSSKASRRKRSRSMSSGVLHTSVFRGVSCCGKDRKFQARIRDGSKVHYLGRFDNEFDAALRYDEAARSHKGDSAIPNFVEMNPQEIRALRAHYFSNDQTILPEFYRFLSPPTMERVELKRAKLGSSA